MLAFSFILLALSSATAALPSPHALSMEREAEAAALERRSALATRSTRSGIDNGFYYTFWANNEGQVTYTNGDGGSYSVEWQNAGNFVGGKGFNPGGVRNVTYSGSWTAGNANSYLSLYGWTRNPLVEYYIVETYGIYNPASAAKKKGTIAVDGGTYDILQTTRTNEPSIEGTATFEQFWSVRQQKRVGGTVDVGAHFDAWAKLGQELGTHDYMIVATEGYKSSGSANITVHVS